MDGKCTIVVFGLTDTAVISAHAGVAIPNAQTKEPKRAIPNRAFVNAMHEYSADQCIDTDPDDDNSEGSDEHEPDDMAMGDVEADGVGYSDLDPGEETEVERAGELNDE